MIKKYDEKLKGPNQWNKEQILDNPISSFLMVHEIVKDWQHVEMLAEKQHKISTKF